MRRIQFLSDAAAAITLVNAQTATQDPLTGSAFGAVPSSWGNDKSGAIPEFDLTGWAAGTVTLTNVELFCAVARAGVFGNHQFLNVNAGTDTITLAAAHNLLTGDGPFQIANAGGALPTPLATLTNYWIIYTGATTVKFATSLANAMAGTAIDLTDAGSGAAHQIDGVANQQKLVRWLSLGIVAGSLALTSRRGRVMRVTGHQHALAYAIGAAWSAAVAASFELVPVEER